MSLATPVAVWDYAAAEEILLAEPLSVLSV